VTPVDIAGQTAPAKKPVPALAGGVPRLADGHPDLQGTFDLGTITPLERRAGTPLVLTDEEAQKLEAQAAKNYDKGNAQIAGDRAAPPKGGDGTPGPYGNVGGYNNFWLDPGSQYTTVDGRKRASLLIDPPDGRVPALTDAARKRNASARLRTTSDQVIREDDPGFEGADAYDDPEQRPLGERCIIGFSSTSGPPILPTYFYNNLHQIVQTADTVVILTEMVHDARIVRMGAEHVPSTIRKWMGDSIGRWDGDTLVIDTIGFNGNTRLDTVGHPHSDALHMIQTLLRTDAGHIAYTVTIDDPKAYTRPWKNERTWTLMNTEILEYSCEENNKDLRNGHIKFWSPPEKPKYR
jgi:hypothetical protein